MDLNDPTHLNITHLNVLVLYFWGFLAQEHGNVRSLIGINNGANLLWVLMVLELLRAGKTPLEIVTGGERMKSSQVSSTCEREGAVSGVFVAALWDRERI